MKRTLIILFCILSSLMLVSCYEIIGEQTIVGTYHITRCPFINEPRKGAIYSNEGKDYIITFFHYDLVELEIAPEDKTYFFDDIPFEGDTLIMTGKVTKRIYKGDDYYLINGWDIRVIARGHSYYDRVNRELERQKQEEEW